MTDICENTYDEDGNPINGDNGNGDGNNICIEQPGGEEGTGASSCPDTGGDQTCRPYQLTDFNDNCLIDDYVEESLNIASADVNVFKLLGIHEQTKLVDIIGNGDAISGGDKPGFAKEEAFTTFITEWRSAQTGNAAITSAYIGYDFGVIKLDNNRRRYGIDTSIKHNIATIKLKQGNNSKNRATKIRVERSVDAKKWYGVAILTLADDDCLNTYHFRNTAPMRYWRIRPIEFNGDAADSWAIQAFEMSDFDLTSIQDIQDKVWNENRDRDYASETIHIKAYYDLVEPSTLMARFGNELDQGLEFTASFNATVAALGRPIVIGDIFEVPSEMQYDPELKPIKKYLEVIDVKWSTDGYTPGWTPTLQRISTEPMIASQETADIVGGLESYEDDLGFLQDFNEEHPMEDGDHPIHQDYSDVSQTIEEKADDKTHLPERGRDPADIQQFSQEQIDAAEQQAPGAGEALKKLSLEQKGLYVEDAMPPNGLPFTEGDSFPGAPSNGDFHRLTYTGFDENIPPRLFRYSTAKNRWVFLESDKRAKYRETKPVLQEFLGSSTRKPSDEIGK